MANHLIRKIFEGRVFAALVGLLIVISALPSLATPVAAQGTTTVTIQAFDADGVTPLPFARFQIVDSTGVDYGKQETGLDGTTTFSLDVQGDDRTYTVSEETPPACGIAPDPQDVGPFTGGESISLQFTTTFDPNCNLGTLAVYRYTCPETFDTTSTNYQDWSAGCPDEVNGIPFIFTSVSSQQTWNPVTGEYGIAGRAPIVGLPPGEYTIQQQDSLNGKIAAFYCLTYDTPNYNTSPSPSDISRVGAPDGLAQVPLNNNRVSCDMFVAPAPANATTAPTETSSEPEQSTAAATETASEPGQPTTTPIGQATTTSDLNLRSEPDDNGDVLVVMPSGTEVDVLGPASGDYTPVRFQGQDGWAGTAFLSFANGGAPTEAPSQEATATTVPADVSTSVAIGNGVTSSDVNFRTGPSTDSDVISVLPSGTTVEILGNDQNGFTPIRVQGQDGWISTQFLVAGGEISPTTPTATGAPPTATATLEPTTAATTQPIGTAYTNDSVNMRDDPSLDSDVLQVLDADVQVAVLGPTQNGFTPVRSNDEDGWVSNAFLSDEPLPTVTSTPTETSTPTLTPTTQPTTVPIGTMYTNDSVNMRAEANLDADVLQVLDPGVQVDVLGPAQNGFTPVRFNGQDGWVSTSFLSDQPLPTVTLTPTQTPTTAPTTAPTQTPTTEPTTASIGTMFTTSSVNMRKDSSLDSDVLQVLDAGVQVDVLGPEQNGFIPVRYQDENGWVSAGFLSDQAPTTPTQTVAPSDLSATLELHKAACDPGYIPGPDIYNDCHDNGLSGITFSVQGPNDFSDSEVTTLPQTPGPGVAIFNGLESGSYSIDEDVPGDFTSIYVYCSLAQSDDAVSFTYNNDIQGIDIDLSEGESVICDWYNIPDQQQADTGTVEVIKHTCPIGYDATDSVFNDFVNDCPSLTNGITFGLVPDGVAETPTRVTGDDGTGKATFSDAYLGRHFLNEQGLDSSTTPYAYCGPDYKNLGAVPVQNGSVVVDLSSDNRGFYCIWFDVETPASGHSSLEFHKAVCEPGYVPGPNIFDDCHGNGLGGVTFSVDGPNDYDQTGVTTVPVSPGPGVVTFNNLNAGNYTISEDVPGDFTSIYVYCSMANSEQSVDFTYTDDGQGIELSLGDYESVICDWYNIPDQQYSGTVKVVKRTCPIGYDATDAVFNDFWTDCKSLTNDVDFTLTPDGGTGAVRTTGDDGSGTAVFYGQNAGSYSLSEGLPGEFVTSYAYCGPDDKNLSATPVSNGGVGVELTGDQASVICLWYNVPEDTSGKTGSISLTKYLCPEGTSAGYWDACSGSPLANATFNLDGPGEVAGQLVTGNSGAVAFNELPAGNYSIQEIPPDGVDVAVYVVACQAGGAAYKFNYDDATGMRIKLNLPPGAEIFCNWYNVPKPKVLPPAPGTGGNGSITVHKFICSGKKVSEYSWDADCPVETSGAGFSLKDSGGKLVSTGTTNTSGSVTFTGLANGAYSLDETTGNWCHAEADKVDASGRVIVGNNANTDVFIYNCGNVGSLPSTGVGSMANDSGPSNWWYGFGGLALLAFAYLLQKRRQGKCFPVKI